MRVHLLFIFLCTVALVLHQNSVTGLISDNVLLQLLANNRVIGGTGGHYQIWTGNFKHSYGFSFKIEVKN
jgi:hypothetical protein